MLIDIISQYDDATREHLRGIWQWLVKELQRTQDSKKIVSFLNKSCIIAIDEDTQEVTLWIPNEFVLLQVKKFFKKALDNAIKETFENHYTITFVIYPPLQTWDHPLQINLKKNLDTASPVKKQLTLPPSILEELSQYFGILFDPTYTFDTYVMGAYNELAVSAAKAIAESPGEIYNPFFLYGNVWLGKTHLMQAIGNQIMKNFPDKVVLYLPTSSFIDKIIDGVRNWKLWMLQQKLQEVDILMLDDIQFLAGKERTQEIFHTIFNDFYSKKKQIVLTSDRPPKELTLLESRLQSRFALGLVADIKTPDTETRVAILQSKLKAKWQILDDELLQVIAEVVNTNVRELEWALNIVMTRKILLWSTITPQHVRDALATLGFETPQVVSQDNDTTTIPHYSTLWAIPQHQVSAWPQKFGRIIEQLCEAFDLEKEFLLGSKRTKEYSRVRQLAMFIAKQHYHWSLQKIGDYFWGKNHASVIYAIKQSQELMKNDERIQSVYTSLWL